MSNILRFGIPSLDELFGGKDPIKEAHGILLPGGNRELRSSNSVSICISGPDGTGKSVLGLHLASRYLADCYGERSEGKPLPKVLYVSTDLKFKMAEKMWVNFGLDYPNNRAIPFAHCKKPEESELRMARIALQSRTPLGMEEQDPAKTITDFAGKASPLAMHLIDLGKSDAHNLVVHFVNMASYTVGDDWGYINRVLSLLEKPDELQPRHLIVFDSIEGFEMLVGERDAFGETQSRRSRIAQVMRSAAEKCHMLLIVEEPEEGKRLPEEFVTDVVIRLRSVMVKDYVRRTLELEKVRGHSHTRGQHSYLIRSGSGSSTGKGANPDDPRIPAVTPRNPNDTLVPLYQSYLHVCQSLHSINREIMVMTGRGRPANPPNHFAAFGIHYLDDLLDGQAENVDRQKGDDKRGLPCSTVTALIGNSETKKSPLGTAFLSRCFTEYAERYFEILKKISENGKRENGTSSSIDAVEGEKYLPVDFARLVNIFRRLSNLRIPKSATISGLNLKPELGDYLEVNKDTRKVLMEQLDTLSRREKIASKEIEKALEVYINEEYKMLLSIFTEDSELREELEGYCREEFAPLQRLCRQEEVAAEDLEQVVGDLRKLTAVIQDPCPKEIEKHVEISRPMS